MNELQVFKNPEFGTVRTVEVNGELGWLVRMWRRLWVTPIPARP